MLQKVERMRYERLKDIIDMQVRLQGSRTGVTLEDIRQDLSVSRRTAERMRNAVEWAFGTLETVPVDDNRLHCDCDRVPCATYSG